LKIDGILFILSNYNILNRWEEECIYIKMEEVTAEIREISFGSLLFRHIDRILSLSNRDFTNDEQKLFTFTWSIKLLRSSMPDDILDKDFKKNEAKLEWVGKTYKEKFEDVQDLFSLCVNHLAKRGYLYRKVADGEYDV